MTLRFTQVLFTWLSAAVCCGCGSAGENIQAGPWPMHVIDSTSSGADGTKTCFVNGDSLPDIVTGWEQGNLTRLYLNPGPGKGAWPCVEVPSPDVEDALVADLDGDGRKDIVTLSEGERRRITVHWAPPASDPYTDSNAWFSEDIPASVGRTKWMFAATADIDGKYGIDLIAGSKAPDGTIGWLEAPPDPRDMAGWNYHEMSPAGWIMSVVPADMNGDGLPDILISDRKGPDKAVRWLEHPGRDSAMYSKWNDHVIGLSDGEPMFLALEDINGDGRKDMVVPDREKGWAVYTSAGHSWEETRIPYPAFAGVHGKSAAIEDIDSDGKPDLIGSFEGAADRSGVLWISDFTGNARPYDLSGPKGIKFDLVVPLDMDGDGDPDILTSEENNNSHGGSGLGVIWYENPL